MTKAQPGLVGVCSFLGAVLVLGADPSHAQTAAAATRPVTFTVTASSSADKVPAISQGDVQLTLGRDSRPVTNWAKDDNLALAILIDESIDRGAASNWPDLRTFIMEMPATTLVAVGYLRNNVTTLAQDFTTNHEAAAAALRPPTGGAGVAPTQPTTAGRMQTGRGTPSASARAGGATLSSPYLATLNLLTRWPAGGPQRRSILLISSGIDFFRGPQTTTLFPDVDPLVARAQMQNTNVWAVFFPAGGHQGRNTRNASDGQNNLSRVTEGTGGEFYGLGFGRPVSLKPFFDQITTNLNNQYMLTFAAPVGATARHANVNVTTEVPDAELFSASAVFLPAAK